jgi:hypothetical protein
VAARQFIHLLLVLVEELIVLVKRVLEESVELSYQVQLLLLLLETQEMRMVISQHLDLVVVEVMPL